jgi:hypothetical protein
VLVSILIATELAGILGGLLAIPVAGVIQVIVCDLWNPRQGRIKDEPTVGADEAPVSRTDDSGPPESERTPADAPRARPGDPARPALAAVSPRR